LRADHRNHRDPEACRDAREDGRSPLVVRYTGRSMWPSFQEGDLLIAVARPQRAIRRGDCIVFSGADGRCAVHRVVRTHPQLLTRGDALSASDEDPVDPEGLLGVVVERVRLGRTVGIAGGLRGSATGRILGRAGRLDPLWSGRGAAVARLLRVLAHPLARLLVDRATVVPMNEHGSPAFVTHHGRVMAASGEDGSGWVIPWPLTLVIQESDLPSPV
jgi:hypothetical protein